MQIQNSACKVFVLKTRKSLSMVKISTSIDLQYCKTDPFCNGISTSMKTTGSMLQNIVVELSDESLVLSFGYRSVAKHTFSHQYA